jgi:hypothetical protein
MYTVLALGSDQNNFTNLGSLYNSLVLSLLKKSDWTIKTGKKVNGRFHLLLGEAQASNISYKVLSGYNSLYPGLCPIVNFYRGFNSLCRKAMMAKTLQNYLSTHQGPPFERMCPETFAFYPAKREKSEYKEFCAAAEATPGPWILKPSDGCKGHSIRIMSNPEEILSFIDSQSDGSIAWVVQRYLENPILVPVCNRKFDIRVWVLLDPYYNIHVYEQGVLRVTACEYIPGNWDNLHSHLSVRIQLYSSLSIYHLSIYLSVFYLFISILTPPYMCLYVDLNSGASHCTLYLL